MNFGEIFLTRKQYDTLLVEMAGFVRCAYPLLKKEWSVNGVRVIATKKQHVQYISKLRAFNRDFPA